MRFFPYVPLRPACKRSLGLWIHLCATSRQARGLVPLPAAHAHNDYLHARGRKLRFWNVPDHPETWQALLETGVDVIGSDDLPGLQTFLLERMPAAARR